MVTVYPDMTQTPFYNELDFAPGEEHDTHITPKCVADAVIQAADQRDGTVITQIVIKPQRIKVLHKRPPKGSGKD